MSSEKILSLVNNQIFGYDAKLRVVSRDTSHDGYVLMLEYKGAIKALQHLKKVIDSYQDVCEL